MSSPSDRRYAESHEWHKLLDSGLVEIGISQHAVDELTDITYVGTTLDVGDTVDTGGNFGEIESVKTNSELYSGVAGEVVEINQEVMDNPELINEDCYSKGWLIRVKPSNASAVDSLMDADAYDANT